MHTITIGDDSFDEEFLIARHLAREEFDRSFDDLLLLDIQEGEFGIYFTLVLVVSGIESDKIPHSFYTCFFQFFDIHIGGMEEGLRELHFTLGYRKTRKKQKIDKKKKPARSGLCYPHDISLSTDQFDRS